MTTAANMVLCDGEGSIADIEIRPEGVQTYQGEQHDCIIHTNHYLTSAFARYETGTLPDSQPRLARLSDLIKERWGSLTVDAMKAILADHAGHPAAI